MPAVRSGYRGTVAECLANEEEEFELDSESNRRILATRRYISYDTLQRNNVPCSRRVLLQLPPRFSGQPLQARLQRHHMLQELSGFRISTLSNILSY
ncbi:hypothetical protein SASPL_129496 [Salvia splendens]|uniref:Uncharacterized protein n=1 Tax=Salvia splendens TaxID=180675 RepID=A0A8X8XF35_SALSN|nr:hypothetical protein SASPL_129496 [Salvia splendens]